MPQRKKIIRHDEIVARFGQRLRELRLGTGMSQAELARQADVTTNYISRLEGGGAAPGIDLVARLALALGVPIADLLPTRPSGMTWKSPANKRRSCSTPCSSPGIERCCSC